MAKRISVRTGRGEIFSQAGQNFCRGRKSLASFKHLVTLLVQKLCKGQDGLSRDCTNTDLNWEISIRAKLVVHRPGSDLTCWWDMAWIHRWFLLEVMLCSLHRISHTRAPSPAVSLFRLYIIDMHSSIHCASVWGTCGYDYITPVHYSGFLSRINRGNSAGSWRKCFLPEWTRKDCPSSHFFHDGSVTLSFLHPLKILKVQVIEFSKSTYGFRNKSSMIF